MVLHDMPRHDNRVDLDDAVKDAWGLPAARITLTPHDNDLKQGRFLIDRAADILEAAGSKKVQKVYAQRVTGNCSHQHGTLRMGGIPRPPCWTNIAARTKSTISMPSTAPHSPPRPARTPP